MCDFAMVALIYKLLQTAQLIQQITQSLNHLRQSTSTLTRTIALEQLAAEGQNACRMAQLAELTVGEAQ